MKRSHGSRLPSFLSSLFRRSLFLLTSHVSLLTFFFALPAFSQQRWERTYGGAGDDYGYSVQQTQDGGYILAGKTTSFGNGEQVYLIKTNASGDTLWTKTYGGTSNDGSHSIQQTTDGGYIVTGYTYSFGNNEQAYLFKTNASGDTLWTKTYGGTENDLTNSVQQTTDGGYITTGTTLSFGAGNGDIWLIKTNASGDTLWTRTYGGLGPEGGQFVQQTSDTGYIITGWTTSFGSRFQVYLIKTNASGDTLWTRTYGGAWDELGFSVQQTSDAGYVIAGYTNTLGSVEVYLVKTNASGDTLWTKNYGDTHGEFGYSVQQTSDGGYIVVGQHGYSGSNPQVYLIKTNGSGDALWTRTYGEAFQSAGNSVKQTTDDGYIVAGTSSGYGNGNQVYLIKTDANGNVGVEVSPSHESRVSSYGVFPNPFTSFASVPGHTSKRFALYDISGRKVGIYKGDRIGEGLSAGVYFLRPFGGNAKPLRIVKLR